MNRPPFVLFAALNLLMSSSMALFAASPWAPLALALFAVAQPGVDPVAADSPMLRWILGIAGGVWAGWSTVMWGLARGWPAPRALQAGLVLWCVFDSAASLANGAALNVLVNVVWAAIGLVTLRGGVGERNVVPEDGAPRARGSLAP